MSKAAGIIRISDDTVMKWCPSVAAAYREMRSNYGSVEYKVEPMDIIIHRQQSPKAAQIRTLQAALSLIIAKYDDTYNDKGVDAAMRYHAAGGVVQSMIEELRK